MSVPQIASDALLALMWNVVTRVFSDDPTRLRLAEFLKTFNTPRDDSVMVLHESYTDCMHNLAEAIRMWNVDTVAGALLDGWIDTLRQMDFTTELSLNPESDINKCDQRIKYAQDSILFIGGNSAENCNEFVVNKIRRYVNDLQHRRSIIVVSCVMLHGTNNTAHDTTNTLPNTLPERVSQELTSELTALQSKWVEQLEQMRRSKCDALFTPSATLLTRLEVRLFDYDIVNGEHNDWDVEAMDTITNLWHILCYRAQDPAAPKATIAKMHELNSFE
jgi:hypothetical protein